MTIKGFFFDLDGTLVNTHESNYRAYCHAIESIRSIRLGNELKVAIANGEDSKVFLPRLIPGLSAEDLKAINDMKSEVYPQYLDVSELNNYLFSFLRKMSKHHITVLVTTAKPKNAMAVVNRHNLGEHFSLMVLGDEVENMKPHPQAYILALKKSGLNPDEVIAFEDSDSGIASAEAAGIKVIRVRDFM